MHQPLLCHPFLVCLFSLYVRALWFMCAWVWGSYPAGLIQTTKCPTTEIHSQPCLNFSTVGSEATISLCITKSLVCSGGHSLLGFSALAFGATFLFQKKTGERDNLVISWTLLLGWTWGRLVERSMSLALTSSTSQDNVDTGMPRLLCVWGSLLGR